MRFLEILIHSLFCCVFYLHFSFKKWPSQISARCKIVNGEAQISPRSCQTSPPSQNVFPLLSAVLVPPSRTPRGLIYYVYILIAYYTPQSSHSPSSTIPPSIPFVLITAIPSWKLKLMKLQFIVFRIHIIIPTPARWCINFGCLSALFMPIEG